MSNIYSINREENGYVHADLLGGGDAYVTKQKQPKRNNDYGSTGTFSLQNIIPRRQKVHHRLVVAIHHKMKEEQVIIISINI